MLIHSLEITMGEVAEFELHIPALLAPDGIAKNVADGVKRLKASGLFGNARELVIEHAGSEYRLRITNSGKLILTK